jgi:hypothetical protein
MAIGKLTKGADAGGLMAYLTQENDQAGELRDRAEIIGGTVLGDTAKSAADELSDLKALRPGLEKNMAHMSIRLHEDDRDLSDAQWLQAAEMWADGMGFESYAVVSHGDHIHIAASRIKIDGSVVSDSHDWRRSEALIRDIEERFDLVKVESSHLLDYDKSVDHKKSPSLAEIAMSERGEVPIKAQLQGMIEDLINQDGGITASDFVEQLELAGVDVRPNVASTGRLNGFSYGFEGVSWTSKELGRGFSLRNIITKGFNYEQDRDFQSLRKASERSKEREHIRSSQRADSSITGSEKAKSEFSIASRKDRTDDISDARADREVDIAVKPGSGSSDSIIEKRDEQAGKLSEEVSRTRSQDSERINDTSEQHENAGSRSDQNSTQSSGRSEDLAARAVQHTGSSQEREKNTNARTASVSSSAHTSSAVDGTRGGADALLEGDTFEDLIAFFRRWSAQMKQSSSKNTPLPQTPKYKPEAGSAYASIMRSGAKARTAQIRESKAIEQMKAFGCAKFEMQDIPPKGSKQKVGQVRELTPDGVIKHLDYMASQNAKGRDIYIRPAPVKIDGVKHAQPYIFVDDVNKQALSKLESLGLPLAIKVESSPGNFHGWVRVGNQPLTTKEATQAAKIIAVAVGSDEGSADWRHHGRMAGFTNQKPSRRTPKGPPFVKLTTDKNMDIAANGPALIAAARQQLSDEAAKNAEIAANKAEKLRRYQEASTRKQLRDQLQNSDVFAHVAEARERHRKSTDESRTDLSAALSAVRAGFDPEDIKDAIRACSPGLEERHQDVESYLNKTLDRAEDYIRQDTSHRRP